MTTEQNEYYVLLKDNYADEFDFAMIGKIDKKKKNKLEKALKYIQKNNINIIFSIGTNEEIEYEGKIPIEIYDTLPSTYNIKIIDDINDFIDYLFYKAKEYKLLLKEPLNENLKNMQTVIENILHKLKIKYKVKWSRKKECTISFDDYYIEFSEDKYDNDIYVYDNVTHHHWHIKDINDYENIFIYSFKDCYNVIELQKDKINDNLIEALKNCNSLEMLNEMKKDLLFETASNHDISLAKELYYKKLDYLLKEYENNDIKNTYIKSHYNILNSMSKEDLIDFIFHIILKNSYRNKKELNESLIETLEFIYIHNTSIKYTDKFNEQIKKLFDVVDKEILELKDKNEYCCWVRNNLEPINNQFSELEDFSKPLKIWTGEYKSLSKEQQNKLKRES